MIIVEGWIRLAPDDIERFAPAAEAVAHATRAEPGCLQYALARDLFESDLLRLSERWRDEAALAAHIQTPHVAAFNKATASLQYRGANVHVYSARHERAMIER